MWQTANWNANKFNFIKIKNYYVSKYINNRVKRKETDWEKIFAKHILNKGIIFKIYLQRTLELIWKTKKLNGQGLG
jgi:hypothetical protein